MNLQDVALKILREQGAFGLEDLIKKVQAIHPDERAVNIKIAAMALLDAEYAELDDMWRFTAVPFDVYNARLKEAQQREIDENAVNRFTFAMKAKLAKSRQAGRGGWNEKDLCSAEDLSRMLREHVEKGDPVDVANFCMFLHQRGEGIL